VFFFLKHCSPQSQPSKGSKKEKNLEKKNKKLEKLSKDSNHVSIFPFHFPFFSFRKGEPMLQGTIDHCHRREKKKE